jgi:hypothetical protein
VTVLVVHFFELQPLDALQRQLNGTAGHVQPIRDACPDADFLERTCVDWIVRPAGRDCDRDDQVRLRMRGKHLERRRDPDLHADHAVRIDRRAAQWNHREEFD